MSQGLDYSDTAEQLWSQVVWRWLKRQPWPLRAFMLFVVYLSLGLLLEAFADHYRSAFDVQPWDPASGLHIVLLFGFGFRYAPAIFLVPFLEGIIWSAKSQTYYLFEAVSALYVCLGYSGAAYFLLHYQDIDPCLRSLKDMLWFTAVFLGTALAISGLSLFTQQTIAAPLGPDWSQKWMHDWAGEANGIMMLAPPCLLLMRLFPWSGQHLSLQGELANLHLTEWFRQNLVERIALIGGIVLSAWLAYGGLQGNATEFSYITFVPVIWVAVKWGLRRTTACLLILNVFSVMFASSGTGNDDDVLAIQFGLLTVTTVGAVLGAYVTDYRLELERRQHLESKLRYQATHDSLTGLYSRIFFRQQLAKVVERSEGQSAGESALLFIDIDRFKDINDTLGHLVGDRLLSSIANRIEYCLSEKLASKTFFACRFSGDEFVVLITPAASTQVSTRLEPRQTNQETIEDLARYLCNCLAEVYEIDGYRLPTTVSIGIAFSDSIHEDSDDLLRNADIALCKAKAAGRGQYMIFDHQMYEELVSRSQLERDLSQAISQIDDYSVDANG